MTELEEARAHLKFTRELLARARFSAADWFPDDWGQQCERGYLAALSWVWDAQEREALEKLPDGALIIMDKTGSVVLPFVARMQMALQQGIEAGALELRRRRRRGFRRATKDSRSFI